MGKPSAPAAPDYKGAAEATAAGSRVNQYTPWGSSTYAQTGKDSSGNPMYSQTVALSPVQQQLLDAQNRTSMGLSNLQGAGLGAVQNLFGNLPSSSQLPAQAINPGQTAQDAIMARQMPMLNQQRDRMENQLANQGIQLGSDAYKQAEDQFGRQVNDATSQAALQGIDVTNQARQQGMNEQGFYSQMPINLLNAVRTGSQVQSPTFGATAQGPNYMGASQLQGQSALDQYNSKVGSYNSMMGGLMSLGGMAALSDRRLKSNIVKIGEDPRGFGYYEYDIFGRRERGVMADELEKVIPDAVVIGQDGYKRVRYGML